MESKDMRDALRSVFEEHSDELFRHCYFRLSNRDRALELTQEAFARAWEYMSRGNKIDHYRPFLYRTINNLIVDEYRKHKMQSLDAMLENDDTREAVEGEFLRDDAQAIEDAIVRFDAALAMEALYSVQESYRQSLVLRYIDGFSPKEIASMTGESENVVSVRIHRGLKKLRDIIDSRQQKS